MTTPQTAPANKTSETQSRTWKPMAAGILMIIIGLVTLVAEIINVSSGDFGTFAGIPFIESTLSPHWLLFATGIIGTAGGILALSRKIWWLVVVCLIISMLFPIWPVLVLGILTILCIATSSKEFKRVKSS